VVLATSVFWLLSANRLFFASVLSGRAAGEAATWGLVAGLAVLVAAVQAALLLCILNRWTVKPLLTVQIVRTALATYFMDRLGIYLDPSMLRNVVRTNPAEARELLTLSLVPHLLL
jgi:lipid A ethanolaminephosphotransferase